MSFAAEGQRRAPSLRHRLMLWMGAGFVVLLVIISALLWSYARGAANRTYDLLLAGAALSILETVSAGEQGIQVDLPHSAFDILGLAPQDRVFYRVSSGGRTLTGQDDLVATNAPPSATPVFADRTYGGAEVRTVTQSRRIALPEGASWVTVDVAQTRLAREARVQSLFYTGLAGLGFVSFIGLLFVWLATRKALKPLDEIAQNLSAREPSDLTRVDIDPPREVTGLIEAINGFMGRLDQTRRQSEAFMADVAHQTRTSLAAMQGHLSLAADAKTKDQMGERLRRAEEQAAKTTRLTNQLLSHAMVIHRADNQAMQPLDLGDLVRQLLSEMLRDTAFRHITVTLEDDADGKAVVPGDPISLREALRNVIENAVRHGPRENALTVRLYRGAGAVVLDVEDEGPGIPQDQRADALLRFRSLARGSDGVSGANGSGLGLAIVKAVADAHGAKLDLEAGAKGGLLVRLAFGGTGTLHRPRFGAAAAVGLALLALSILPMAPAQAEVGVLEVWSATDEPAMRAVLDDFQRNRPAVEVVYREFDTVGLHEALLTRTDPGPDVVISSAMDLQVDLVNRGLASPLNVAAGALPSWARWRSELFGFTFEPAAVIYHRPTLAAVDLPKSRAAIADFIRDNEIRFNGKIATYDIRTSGAGYLFATQEAQLSPQFFRLAETLGRANVRLYGTSGDMIERTARGELILGINVIGSYALAAARALPDLGVYFFDDFNPVMSRSVFVPRGADDPDLGARFVQYLVSDAGQEVIADASGLLPISQAHLGAVDVGEALGLSQDSGQFTPIRLSVGLLTYLDDAKRRRFLSDWQSAVQD
ncbi:MAG: extracellular solute-binding protein [Pseudomonadota bacterium]